MSFLLQLRILLWKNLTLKRRSPFVLLFEIFIPLVLFVILLCIRYKQPPYPVPESHSDSKPLPSAGVIAVMQAFCEGGEQDQRGFYQFPNSTVYQFLENFQSIAENNNFFDPGFSPTEMDRIPDLYERIIDDPALLHSQLKKVKYVEINDLLVNASELMTELSTNFSIPYETMESLLSAQINLTELYRIVFGPESNSETLRFRRDLLSAAAAARKYGQNIGEYGSKTSLLDVDSLLNNLPMDLLPEKLSGGLLYDVLKDNPKLLLDPQVRHLVAKVLSADGHPDMGFLLSEDAEEMLDVLKKIIITKSSLKYIICSKGNVERLFSSPDQNLTDSLKFAQKKLCNLSSDQWNQFVNDLSDHIDSKEIVEKFDLMSMNVSIALNRIANFESNMEEFIAFQRNLILLSHLSSHLPRATCQSSSLVPKNATIFLNSSSGDHLDPNDNSQTDQEDDDKRSESNYDGLMKLWIEMQSVFCGQSTVHQDIIKKSGTSINLDDFGLSKTQKYNLGLLVNLLYNNPKVLYTPNGTAADEVIKKANETFSMVDRLSEYARTWLVVSTKIRNYLLRPSTEENIEHIKQIQKDVHSKMPEILKFIHNEDVRAFFQNSSLMVVSRSVFLDQLDLVDNAACGWLSLMKGININVFKGFATEGELVDYFLNDAYANNVQVLASVVFTNVNADGSLPPHVVYKIRQNASFTDTTKSIRDKFWHPGPGSWPYKYYQFGFVWIQDMIERALIEVQVGHDVLEPGTYVHHMPHPCYIEDQFLFMIEHVMPLCLTISWVYTVAMLVQSIVYEKEQRLKEVMRMMGLTSSVHWLAWFLTTFTQMSVTMAILTVMLKYGSVLKYSDPLLIFVVLEMFAVATIAFSFLVSVCYSKAKVAAACAGIVYFLSYVPYMYIAIREEAAGDRISAFVKSLASLLSTTGFGLGAKYFAFYEIEGVGVQWNNIAISPVEDDQYNLLLVVMMMFLDALIYSILTWYIENVHPGSYGLPKPWYFPLTKSYWCGYRTRIESDHCTFGFPFFSRSRSAGLSVTEQDQACAMDRSSEDLACHFEKDPDHLRLGVHIDQLTKKYKNGKLAVNKLSLNLYEGHITSFLGHNGAGKTTTMSILTGLFPPTSGYATIYDLDIRSDMEEIRKSLGMCPQHNILFDKLTVEEHLWLYARLKGMSSSDINLEMERMIGDLGLQKKRWNSVDCLSGGMKRKLSVAIAFVAGSRTVILDEPTAGVDPYARRAIWDLLLKYKEGRTILLSTHHMDEADVLGDRIAIISNGQLKCCGSSLFLKSMFGDGYHLVLVKKRPEEDLQSSDTLSFEDPSIATRSAFQSRCLEEKITQFVTRHVQTAYLECESSQELQYILPFEEAKKGAFEKLFIALDASMGELKISSYGVRDSSLEEIFLRITDGSINNSDLKPFGANQRRTNTGAAREPVPPDAGTDPGTCNSASSSVAVGGVNELELDSIAGGIRHHARQQSIGSYSFNSDVSDLPLLTAEDEEEGHRDHPEVGKEEEEDADDDDDDDVPLLDQHRSVEENPVGTETRRNERPTLSVEGQRCRSVDPAKDGQGSYVLSGSALYLQQFFAILVKRFYYISRNWKALFSQILLPGLFVCIAMTVALTAPQVQDLPAKVLSPAQYYNYTQPRGNFIPYSVVRRSASSVRSGDANAERLAKTFRLPSGVAATCVLRTPFNSSYDSDILKRVNTTYRNFRLLDKYFISSCESVFVGGLPLQNFVPPAVTVSPLVVKNDSLPLSFVTVSPNQVKYHPDCQCISDHTGQLCATDGFEVPPTFQVVTGDHIQDITGDDEEEFYLRTSDLYRLHRYGGFTFGLMKDSVPEQFGKNGPTRFRKLAVRHLALVWFNHKGYHSMPVYLNALNNAILRANLPASKGNPAAYGITAINHPMNNTNTQLSLEYIEQGSDVLIAIFIIGAMSFVPASFVLFLVYERSIKAKHLQIVGGLNRVIYWLANYVWDMINYLIPGTCCIIILKVFDIPAYVSSTNLPAVMALFLLYGWSITPMMYPASFIFNEPSTAYICLIVINLFIGITCIITSFLLEMFQLNSKDLANIHDVLKNIFLIFPNYCLGRGLMDVAFNEYQNEYFFKTGNYDKMKSPFEWKLTVRNMVAMTIMGVVFFIITLLCEFRFFIKPRQVSADSIVGPVNEDVDVSNERRRVLRGRGKRDLLRLQNLTKVYVTKKLGRHLAVDRLCLGVPAGECFGLLGVNGAGKTTTFRMLTGELVPTGGDATLAGQSILRDIYKVQQNIGYCPQFDALYGELTATEHLQLYARLRGVPPKDQKAVVNWALEKLCLKEYASKTSDTYSGGNRRKLSTALALLGHPPIIFLDEPTTGMDPYSRRFLWDLILDLIRDGRSVILTSHSMEECEVLCTRLAVMVNGRFRCLGSTQHLKDKYGDGYAISVRVKNLNYEREMALLKRFMSRRLPEAKLKECHYNLIQYDVPITGGHSLAEIFSKMEEASRDLNIEDYSVSQNMLDNVFINFVKQQQEIVQETDGFLSTGNQSPPSDDLEPLIHQDDSMLETSDEEQHMSQWLNQPQTRLAFVNMEIIA